VRGKERKRHTGPNIVYNTRRNELEVKNLGFRSIPKTNKTRKKKGLVVASSRREKGH